jgi:hypothetical protein
MNEHEALQVVLVKAFESQPADDKSIATGDRRDALREAIDRVGPGGAPAAFVAARAVAASRRLSEQVPATKRILDWEGWHSTWLVVALGTGLVLGVTADVFGGGNRINLLAPPVWLVILWNLVVYFTLFGTLLDSRPPRPAPRSAWKSRLAGALMRLRLRWMGEATSATSTHSSALADFSVEWIRASSPLTTARLVTLLHVASAAVAIGLTAGMYYRGMVADYRVEWGSTFLAAQTVRDILAILLSPALLVSGIQLPDVSQMEALRDSSGLAREQATAAPWIHLYAVMLLITVVLPRTVLACWSGLRAHRLHLQFPLSLEDGYFRSLLRMQRGDTIQVNILPYAQSLTAIGEQNLRRMLLRVFDDSAQIQVAPTTALGEEDNRESLLASIAQATHIIAVFDMTSTPEAENHAVFIRVLEAESKLPVSMLVNASNFVSRFSRSTERFSERQLAWQGFAHSIHKTPLLFDLAEPQFADCVNELKLVLDETAST